jgi:phosphomannomutase
MTILHTLDVIKTSGIAFGTSGARGLVTQFTSDVCAAFTLAFVDSLPTGTKLSEMAIAIDNRPSSYAMAQACSAALEQLGIKPIYYGVVPTPALAFTAMQKNIPCIMVTGSHIPFDRNGLKFYRPEGEITKQDELAIMSSKATFHAISHLPDLEVDNAAATLYLHRYVSLFEQPILAGKHIGIYEHSSAGRDLYKPLFEQLGAQVTSLERSETFVPIDTEAVSDEDKQKALTWSKQYAFDAIFSTDGDGDRPLIADENGHWLRGDILGLLCAKALGIEALAIPVSCNTSVELSKAFEQVTRTKIGSPYVIAEFAPLNTQFTSVAGFEANGGFLLGSDTVINNQLLKALPTRDAVLPAIMLLAASIKKGNISALVTEVSKRFSASDRIKDFATAKSQQLINQHKDDPSQLVTLLGFNEAVMNSDTTDGLRITLANHDIIHLRPSGNAPELRCYAEAADESTAQALVTKVLAKVITL